MIIRRSAALLLMIIALVTLINPVSTSAQKHQLYAHAGLCLDYMIPGVSATYNYNITRHIGIGGGVQAYVWHPAITNTRQFTPALFADFRFRIRPQHISQYFILTDLGMDFYKHSDDYARDGNWVYTAPNNNGVYIGLGIGYFRRVTSRGWPLYATLKVINNLYKENQLHLTTGEQKSISYIDGTFVVSIGFRFGDESRKAVAGSDKKRGR